MSGEVALGVRIVAALHGGAVLVARPRGVVHFHPGALTRTGRAVPAGIRPFCGTRSRRLRVVGRTTDDITEAVSGRRFCRSCTQRLPARLGGRPGDASTREGTAALFGDLTVSDLRLAGTWARDVEETYQVHRLLLMVGGSRPMVPASRRSPEQHELVAAYDAIKNRRAALIEAARTDDDRAETRAIYEAKAYNQALRAKAEQQQLAVEYAAARERNGSYLLPRERAVLGRDRDLADTA